jgi:MFS transporter, ceroid-lipofuscinosis neuronal protein 7
MFTAPAYFMMMVVAGVIGIMLLYFQERDRLNVIKYPAKRKSQKRAAIEEHANQRLPLIGLTIYDCCILGCMLLNIATKGSLSSFETLGISIAMSNFNMPPSEAAVIVATCGTVGVGGLLSMGTVSMYLTDTQLVCIGLLVMCLGILSLSFMDEDDEYNSAWRFSFAIFLIYSIGYPLGHTACIGMFSKSESFTNRGTGRLRRPCWLQPTLRRRIHPHSCLS